MQSKSWAGHVTRMGEDEKRIQTVLSEMGREETIREN